MAARQKSRVLLVDDSDEIREVFSLLLEDAGFETATAGDVEQAFEHVKQERPGLVITDIMLNGPVGLDLITRIRSDLAPPIPEVLACSGFADFREEAMRRGAFAFLAKPVEADDLVATVRAALGNEAERSQVPSIARGAEQRSRRLRRELVQSAAAVMAALRARHGDLYARAQGSVDWLADYLDLDDISLLLIEGDVLRVVVKSGEQSSHFGPDRSGSRWLRLAQDVLETRSNIVLPDVARFFPTPHEETDVSLFVGVPVFGPGELAVGALCVIDEARRNIDSEDLALLETWTRVGSAAFGGTAVDFPPVFHTPGLLTHDALAALIRTESERARRSSGNLELAVLKLQTNVDVREVAHALRAATNPSRRALAVLDDHTLGILLVRSDPGQGTRELTAALSALRARGLVGAGLASVNTSGLHIPGIEQLLSVCEGIAERGQFERLALHGERWASAEASHPA